jgi:hypothetical protein
MKNNPKTQVSLTKTSRGRGETVSLSTLSFSLREGTKHRFLVDPVPPSFCLEVFSLPSPGRRSFPPTFLLPFSLAPAGAPVSIQ